MSAATPLPSDARLLAGLRRCSMLAAVAVMLVPCAVLVGWIVDIEPLKRMLPRLVAMNPLSACNFILCGAALLVLGQAGLPAKWHLAARLAAAFVALTGLLKLVGLIFDFDLQLDQLLFRHKLDLDPVTPNRMAPTTACNFLLIGVALALADIETKRGARPAQALALIVTMVASLAFIGYLYGVKSLTGIARYIPMALHTAVLFITLAAGLLCARPDRGAMARVTSAGAGGAMMRRVWIVILGAPLVMGWLILAGQRAAHYNAEFAFSLLVIAVIIVFSGLIWANAISLDRKEAELEERVQERTANLSQALAEMGQGIEVLIPSARAILESSTRLAAGAVSTATALSETTTTVEEVRQTAHLSYEKAQQVAAAAQAAAEVSGAGRAAAEEMRASMERIRGQMHYIAESMTRLGEQSAAIGDIVAAVEDIATQSRLLAVNASIEAARAGEYGKGFSIVAQEVKALADQSKASTAQVRAILVEIQKSAGIATASTMQGAQVVEAGVAQAHRAGEAIHALAESVARAAQSSNEIALSSRQEVLGMDQIVPAMASIKEASADIADSAKNLEAAARRLHELGLKLSQFRERHQAGS